MPQVDITNKDYSKFKRYWKKCQDLFEGQEKVHDEGEQYLPKLSGQEEDEYKAYRDRTLFYNAFGRTVQGLTGMIMRKPPAVEYDDNDDIATFLEDVTTSGMPFTGFVEEAIEEIMINGRGGILTEYPRVDTRNLTIAEAERLGLRPYWEYYEAEQIRYYRTESINNQKTVTMVILGFTETIPDETDEFKTHEREVLMVLDLTNIEGFEGRRYRQRRFIKGKDENNKTTWVQDGDDIVPRANGEPLEEIPFVFNGVRNSDPEFDKPPLLDLANANINHYQKEADHSNALHVVGVPTPYLSGVQLDEGETIQLGTTTCIVIKDPNGEGGFIELEGKSLDALKEKIESLEERMAFLGARMLAPEKRQAEAAETAQIHRQGEVSVLASMANGLSNAFQKALGHVAKFYGFPDLEITVELNTDFMAWPMKPQMVGAIMKAWQAEAIAFSDMVSALKSGEIVREDRTPEDIQSEIQSNPPAGIQSGGNFI